MATPNDIITLAQTYLGDSLLKNKEDLGLLVARQVDDPAVVVQIKTNCAMFALGIMWACHVVHPLLETKYKSGMAVAWVRKIAMDKKALRQYPKDGPPVLGAFMHYYSGDGSKNDSHIELCLEDPQLVVQTGEMVAHHMGGGRADNAVAMGIGDVRWSYSVSRRMREWIDPVALLVDSAALVL
jgi:hypothetical protein